MPSEKQIDTIARMLDPDAFALEKTMLLMKGEMFGHHGERVRAARGKAEELLTAAEQAEFSSWLDLDCAPKDGTMLRLLVKPDTEEFTSFADSSESFETIGFNNRDNTLEDRWEFAGWDWSHDCFTAGSGEVLGWRPLHTTKAEPAPAAEPDFSASISRVIADECNEGAACGWKPCSGCHETNDGYETGYYPYSKTFGCHVGSGCNECGGLGVVWECWGRAALEEMSRDDDEPATDAEPERKWPAFVYDSEAEPNMRTHPTPSEARLMEALVQIDALDPEGNTAGFSVDALRGLIERMGAIARAAIKEASDEA